MATPEVGDQISTKEEITREKSIEDSDKSEKIEIRTYWIRFWILGIFSFTAFLDISIWGTFGPIMDSVEFAYGWSDGYIALLSSWATIFSVFLSLPFGWVVTRYGTRKTMIIVVICMLVGTGCRCITTNDKAFTYLASVAAILNGIATFVTLALPSMISSTWFPPAERTTATAIGFMAHRLGGVGMYLAPILVKAPDNETLHLNASETLEAREEMKDDIQILMYIHFAACAFVFISIVFAFPEAPPKPPSISSNAIRMTFKETFKSLSKNKNAILALISVTGCFAMPFPWMTVMNFSLQCLGIGQTESMWIAIAITLSSMVCSLIAARLTDILYGHMRQTLVGILLVSAVFYVWFALITFEVIVSDELHVQVYVSVIGAMAIQYAAIPLLTELIIELSYPCPENVLGSIQTFLLDIGSTIFLLLLMIPTDCYKWISGLFVAGAIAVIIPIILLKEEYKRTEMEGKMNVKNQ